MISVNEHRTGLPCRVNGCRFVARPLTSSSQEDLSEASAARVLHERFVHGYIHVVQETKVWGFAQKMTTIHGRSRLGKKG